MLRNWLRAFVRDSVLAGVEDAIEVMAGDQPTDNDTQQRIATLRLRLLPAPEQEEPTTPKRRKAGGE